MVFAIGTITMALNLANEKASGLENYCSPCRSSGGRRGYFMPIYQLLAQGPNTDTHGGAIRHLSS
ncbi:hypothetical protein, partial [Staphylococcus aureus]|uniref:hypothetical protein n=1 Tax=Staphylococcus aureus TaxID=1280 RepID=UPI001C8DA320